MHKRRKCIKPSGSHSLWQEWLHHSSGMHHPCQSYITQWTAYWHGMSKQTKSSEMRGSQTWLRPPTLTSALSLTETRGSCQSATWESLPVLTSKEWSKHPGASCILVMQTLHSAAFKVTKFALFSTSFPLPKWQWEEWGRLSTSGNLMLKKHGPSSQELKSLDLGTVFLALTLNTV